MIPRRLASLLLLLLVALIDHPNSLVLAQAQHDQQSTAAGPHAPGEGDIAIMQKEIKWGMQEMQRYKTFKGEWPVRPISAVPEEREISFSRDKSAEENGNVRGRKPKETKHSNYWNLLVSVF